MREGRRKGKDKHFKHALLPNARHAVVRRPRVECKVAERDSDEISEKLCFGENVRNWWVGFKVEGGGCFATHTSLRSGATCTAALQRMFCHMCRLNSSGDELKLILRHTHVMKQSTVAVVFVCLFEK